MLDKEPKITFKLYFFNYSLKVIIFKVTIKFNSDCDIGWKVTTLKSAISTTMKLLMKINLLFNFILRLNSIIFLSLPLSSWTKFHQFSYILLEWIRQL